MKQIVFSIFLGIALVFFGCDIIEEPYINSNIQPPDPEETVQKVLLEEFTGHQCPNCPAGAQIAKQLQTLYGDRFVIIAYHAGWFARTLSGFTTDYRTTIGTELDKIYNEEFYPAGLINREGNKLDRSLWATAAAEIISREAKLSIQFSKEFNTTSRNLSVTVNLKAIETLNEVKVCVFLTESGLVSPQKTSGDPEYPDGTIPNYVHNNVFRASLNGTWGSSLFEGGAAIGETQSITVSGVLNSNWNENNMQIVCFAYDVETGQIIQVESKPLL